MSQRQVSLGADAAKPNSQLPTPNSQLPTPNSSLPTPISRLFLIGYRGTGKTTVARLLAEKLGWQWLDADEVLEKRQGRTIRQIFAEDGEPAFREIEAGILAEWCLCEKHVFASGGGVILRADNRRRLKESGRVVWLTADPATLWQRLQADTSTQERRPNLASGGLAEIEALLQAREPFYKDCCHFAVDTVSRTPEDVAKLIWVMAQDAPKSGGASRPYEPEA